MDIKEKDRTARATNSIYDRFHRSATEMTGDLVQRKTLVAILTAAYVPTHPPISLSLYLFHLPT